MLWLLALFVVDVSTEAKQTRNASGTQQLARLNRLVTLLLFNSSLSWNLSE